MTASSPALWVAVGGALQVAVLVALAPLLVGAARTVRCRMEGRVGPPWRQTWRDLRKLTTKGRTQPIDAGPFFNAAPVVLVATSLVAIVVSPLLSTRAVMAGGADLYVVVFVLLLGSVSLALASLDTGTAFGGMGASRQMVVVALSEPALLVAILSLAASAHSSSLTVMVEGLLDHPAWLATPQRLFAFAALIVVLLAESGRLPVDNPSTHLELTMIHEAMTLEYSGPDLALVTLGESLRFAFLLALLANLFVPWGVATRLTGLSLLVGAAALVAKVGLLACAIGAGEFFVAKLRLFRVPELLAGAFVLSVLAVVSALVIA